MPASLTTTKYGWSLTTGIASLLVELPGRVVATVPVETRLPNLSYARTWSPEITSLKAISACRCPVWRGSILKKSTSVALCRVSRGLVTLLFEPIAAATAVSIDSFGSKPSGKAPSSENVS